MHRSANLKQLEKIVEIRKIQLEMREVEVARAEAAKRCADDARREGADLLRTLEAEWSTSIAHGGLSSGMGALWGSALLDQQGVFAEAERSVAAAQREVEERSHALSRASYCHDIARQSARVARKDLVHRREEKALAAATDQHPYRWRMP